MTHTPGPWITHQYYEAVFSKSRRICITAPQGTSADKETQANCKLIAAAPDLLEEMEKSQKLIQECVDYYESTGIIDKVSERIIKQAFANQSVIRKATE